jgi:hypothetical protein
MATSNIYVVNCINNGHKFALAIQATSEGEYQKELNSFLDNEPKTVVMGRTVMSPSEYNRFKNSY